MRYRQQSLRGQSFSVGSKLSGEWDKLAALTYAQQTQAKVYVGEGMRRVAVRYLTKLKQNLRSGGGKFSYKALSQGYQEKKTSSGLSGQMFKLSGTLIDSVKIYDTKRGNISVGIGDKAARRPKVGSFGAPKNLTVGQYARILEKGREASGKGGPQPARPIFKDTWKEVQGKKLIAKYSLMYLRKFYRKYGIKV